MRNSGHGMASTACPALALMALFKETTLIKRCFPSAQRSAARLGQSDPKLSGENHCLLEGCERRAESLHPCLHPASLQPPPVWEKHAREQRERKNQRGRVCSKALAPGKGDPSPAPAVPVLQGCRLSSKIDATQKPQLVIPIPGGMT